jgi:hypothetical protein
LPREEEEQYGEEWDGAEREAEDFEFLKKAREHIEAGRTVIYDAWW